MTTAARPTWNPAMGGHTGRDVGSTSLTRHDASSCSQRGQNSAAELRDRNLKAQLQQAEREYTAKKRKLIGDVDEEADPISIDGDGSRASSRGPQSLDGPSYDDYPPSHATRSGPRSPKRARRSGPDDDDVDDPDRDMAISDSDASGSDSNDESSDDDDDSDDSEDETEQLMRELEKIKRERAEERERQERERQAKEEAEREEALLTSNPLLQLGGSSAARPDFTIKKRWDDDVVFKNQARASDEKPVKRFINDTIRSDFHRKFLNKYIH
ncbi:Pre-mRNA-splicing factor Cwf15/Cwc15 [Catenaria anguillulae PL171]|uniref:Pre-mRNA-splicing factor Cwf15/Cwc15 n=1 Tax=Catenaria anguillulae PL171 TaxID=765915 RepID=A0A1Y2HT08_9FUNG|nr:Pre-mRNA-splicing factor Cwf15/Cwc15 [Catenaria anguillulae PL171]